MQTLKDLLNICENYEYSQEYYESFKTVSEIEVMSTYMESLAFSMSDAPAVPMLESTFFCEGDEPSDGEKESKWKSFKSAVGKKKDQFVEWIKKMWERITSMFRTFWNAISKKITTLKQFLQNIPSHRLEKMTDEDVSSIEQIVRKVAGELKLPLTDEYINDVKKHVKGRYVTSNQKPIELKVIMEILSVPFLMKSVSGNGKHSVLISMDDYKRLFTGTNLMNQLVGRVTNAAQVQKLLDRRIQNVMDAEAAAAKDGAPFWILNEKQLKIISDAAALKMSDMVAQLDKLKEAMKAWDDSGVASKFQRFFLMQQQCAAALIRANNILVRYNDRLAHELVAFFDGKKVAEDK